MTVGLAENNGQRLAAADLGNHHGDLAALIDDLGELVRVHAVLAGGGDDVVDQLVLADVDFFLFGDGVEDDFVLEGAGGVGLDLCAVLLGVVLAFTVAVALLEVGFELLFNHRVRNRNLNELNELVQDLVAGLYALLNNLGVGGLLGQVLAEFGEGVELGRQLGEVIVGLGELALLDGLDDNLDLGGLRRRGRHPPGWCRRWRLRRR